MPTSARRTSSAVALTTALLAGALTVAAPSPAGAEQGSSDPRSPVLVWDEHLTSALAAGTPPPASGRVAAIVHGAVFDAVNGVVQQYEPLRVQGAARRGASASAAAVEAGYRTLAALYPARADALAAQRDASLAALHDGGRAIRDGREWGAHVAQDVLAWRAGDAPGGTCTDGTAPGAWRRASDNPAPCALPRLGETAPFGLSGIEVLELPGPPVLESPAYAEELAEVVSYGRSGAAASEATRGTALFWQPNSVVSWNTVARSLVRDRPLELVDQARVFALLDVAMADATRSAWRAKYAVDRWRPVTANEQASADGNATTEPVAGFTPVFPTPSHPDYPSGHATISAAATTVLARLLGDVPFTLTQAGQTRTYPTLSAASEEVDDSRVFAGIHTRSAVEDGHHLGRDLGTVYTRELLLPR